MDDLGIGFVDIDIKKALKEEKKAKKAEKKRFKKEKKSGKNRKREKEEAESDSAGSEDGAGASDAEYDGQNEISNRKEENKRDSWMTANEPSGRNILTGELQSNSKDEVLKKPEAELPKHKAKELNPDGGTGQIKSGNKSQFMKSSVGDGGASWRLKALKRAQTLAEEEGKNVEEVVADRFGSLANLTSHVAKENAAHARAHLHAQRDRTRKANGDFEEKGTSEKADYLQDIGNSKAMMKRPNPGASLSWRKNSDRRNLDRKEPDSGREKIDRGRERRPGNGRDGSKRDLQDMKSAKTEQTFPRESRGANSQKADLLKKVAGKLNTFSNDGSFMAEFQGGKNESSPRKGKEIFDLPSDRDGERAESPLPEIKNSQGVDGDNRSVAEKLRAKLMGKVSGQNMGEKTESEIQKPSRNNRKAEFLPSVDAEGRALPGNFGREEAGKGQIDGGRKVKRIQRFEDGEKQKYFKDDDRSLDELVREQKHHAAENIDANLAENISRKAKFRERDLDVDEEYDVDGGLDMYESRNKKVTKEKAAKRQRTSQIADARRLDNALDNCNLCFGSWKFSKHLLIAMGQVAYLSLPERGRLHPNHCIIIPTEHIASSRKVDEHVWTEMRNFKKCIIEMNAKQGLNTIFWETAMRLTDSRSHAIVHCVPLDDKAFHKAPVVFKKSLDEAESEWSQHHAKAVIDTRAKGLRGTIPANFPYFFVEFGLSAGYAHVIDDEEKFDKDFGRSVVAGLLKLDAEHQKRAAKAESRHIQEKLAEKFLDLYDPFDWTKQLE